MKFIHLSDLHLGKKVHEYSMIEDQDYILKEILRIIDEEKVDAILLAGDIYDKPIPPIEAIRLFDDFLVSLTRRNLEVFIISGNHDSAERITFGSRLMENHGIHFAPVYNGELYTVTLSDAYGKIAFTLLPFIKPIHVKGYFPNTKIETYTDAVEAALSSLEKEPSLRRVLMTHQFVLGASRCDSEDISVGGLDFVDATIFEPFDYVALGHIHSPQDVTKPTIRYCGTPLKYSFSEADQEKAATIVTMEEKGTVRIKTVPLHPKREMHHLRGTYEELTLKSFYENTTYQQDYIYITLTDEEDIPDAVSRLQVIYRNLMKLDYDNQRTRSNQQIQGAEAIETKTPMDLFEELYELQNNQPMSEEQRSFATSLMEKVMEVEL